MKIKDIRKMSEKELMQKNSELDSELVKLYGQVSTGTQLKSPGKIGQIKKTRAQINTVLNEKESLKA